MLLRYNRLPSEHSRNILITNVRMGKKKNRNALSPNAEGVKRGTVSAEDRAPKARGVSMQLEGMGERCKPPPRGSGRSPAAK